MATALEKFKNEVRAKQMEEGIETPNNLENREFTVQKPSSKVAGRTRGYTKLGAHESVHFPYTKVIIDHMKNTCGKHSGVGYSLECNILAAEHGPSCKALHQIPDFKLIYVQFIEKKDMPTEDAELDNNISDSELEGSDGGPVPKKA